MQMYVGASGAGGVEETSPDMLKNTPSNIRRLANEIDRCEGRQKYLAHTRSPSDGGDVRWYFCKVPLAVNEVAASVPRTEIVGKGDYFRFGLRDSLAIEASFLQREDELLSGWWKEYAECSEGPRGQPNVPSKSTLQISQLSSESLESGQLYTIEEERVGVPVKGGLYEVDLVKRHCFPVYWNGENRRVLRGHWFARKGGLDWLPLREDVSEQLEYAYRSQVLYNSFIWWLIDEVRVPSLQVWHRRTFQLSGLFAARVDLQGSTPVWHCFGMHALFTGEDDTWEAWLNVDASGFSGVVAFGGNGIKLRRGYAPSQSHKPTQDELRQQKEEEMDDYCSQVPVGHLVFMVHGIGQRLEKSNLVDDVGNFRQVTANLAERHLTSHQLGTQRVLYIPCQVSNQLNKLFLKFLKRNPGYDGKVSLYGHSLGSVLSYDILCHQETLYSPFPMDWMYKEHKISEAHSSIKNNLSSGNIPISHFVNESSKNLEDESMTGPVDDPDLAEEPVEGTSNPLGPPALSESDGSTTTDIGYQQTNDALASDENANEPFGNFNDIEFYKSDMMNDRNSINSEVGPSDDNKNNKDIPNNDKDETIKSLCGEIDMLKAKIKQFEAEYADKDAKKSTTVVNQFDPDSVQSAHRDSLKSYTPQIRYTKLEFKVDTFFAVGSPLGVFLSLRNVRIGIGKGKEYWEEENIIEEMPACRQMFNIFHPFDPVAYRIEPLVCKEFIHKRPVIIPYHRGGKRLYVGVQEFREELASRSQAVMGHLNTIRVKVLTLCESRSNDGREEESEITQEREERSYGSFMMEKLTGSEDGRIDHVLQDKTFRHPYVSAIGAHTNYWRDYDTALFMLKYLYRDIPEEPDSPSERLEGSEKDDSSTHGWSDPREVADEELPLTFADNISIKSFSHKARRIMKR
ncbi:hypothetical protein RD792_002940 [Penstemon davidsonii]|uniref:DDHD domain-containing protein n=1 Tax=Penstemon davidsonii TaxID=160366 RepID=A0ABR0DTC4_9LAMI|nr:hypothetical protein RD792_002940 [Penstemon davidsonii]